MWAFLSLPRDMAPEGQYGTHFVHPTQDSVIIKLHSPIINFYQTWISLVNINLTTEDLWPIFHLNKLNFLIHS
jgi:hypothetical protein